MPSELFGTSVIFVKVAPGYVERTLTTLRAKPNVAKAEAVFGRHDIAIAGGFRNTDELRGPPREPPRVRRDEGPGHARRALDRDAPGVLEVLNQRLNGRALEPVRPLFSTL